MDHAPQLLGIFTGQGAQWPTMARSLLRSNSVFQQVIKNLDSVLAACDDPPSWTLADQILADADTSRVHEAAIAQPLCTAIQIALVDLLQSLRITFHTVIGHSSGEIAAAYAAGRLTMRDAMLISYYRGRVISQSLHSTDGFRGGMLAVGLSEKDAFGYCRDGDFTSKLFVAAGNASNMATISGDLEMIKQAKDELDSKQILAKVLRVDAAYHSPHMAAAAADYMKALERCQISPIAGGNGIVWISSVYGFKRTSEKDLGAGYWKDNMLYTVQFHDAVDHALSEYGPYDAAIEIGPHASLKLPVCQTATDCGQGLPYVGILDRTKDDSLAVADCLGFLWSTLGPLELHLSPYIEQTPNKKTISSYLEQLPAYPWDHCYPYYKQSRLSRQRLFRQCSPHELLGVRAPDDDEHVRRWRNVLTLDRLPWLRHHRFQGQSLLPASAYCVMILDACRTLSCNRSPTSVELRDIEIVNGVVIDEAPHGTEVMFTMMTLPVGDIIGSSVESSFCLTSCPADGAAGMKLNMTGKARVCFDDDQVASPPLRLPTSRDLRCADSAAFYQMMNLTGLSYTGPFRGVVDIRRRFEYCSAQVANTHESDSTDLMVSPATLDSCFQTAFLTYASPGDKSIWGPLLPCLIGRLYFDLRTIEGMKHTNPAQMLSVEAHLTETHAATPAQPATLAADIAVFGDCGQRAMQVENLVVRAIPNACTNENLTSYLQTVCDLDPEYEIAIMGSSAASDRLDALKGLTDIPQTHITRLCEVVQSTKGTKGTSKHNISEAVNTTNFYNHIGRVVQQISHRHPWMKCLCLPDNSVQLPAHILRKLDGSFRMFTIGLKRGNNSDVCITEKAKTVSQITLDQGRCISTQLVSSNRHDLVILAVSHLERNDRPDLLGTVRNIMKEGGFLVLLHEATGRYNLSRCQTKSGLFTPPDWPDRLMDHSFKSFARHSDQYFPSGHYLMVRQLAVIGPRLPKAMNTSLGASSPGNLIILAHPKGLLGGRVDDLRLQLSAQHARITVRHSIDMVEASVLGACTAVIIVSDEDHPLDTMMARQNLDRFRSMFQPNMKILWVVQNSWSANPGHAAVLGFTRTIAAEVPNLTIQTLDLHDVSSPERHIADAFLKLGMAAEAGDQDDMLWTQEPEIYINSGKRLIPRIKPLRETNERALAFRDPLVKRIDLRENVVAIRSRSEGNGVSQFAAEIVNKNLHAISLPGSMVELEHSSVYPICLSPYPLVYVCVGHDTRTGESIVGLTEQNASHVARSSLLHSCVLQPDSVGGRELVAALCRSLVFELVLTLCRHRSLVLINADIELQHMLSNAEAASSLKIAYYTTSKHISQLNDPKHRSWDFHHLSTSREIRQKFLRAGENTTVIDFSVSEDELSRNIRGSLPSGCLYIQAKTSVFGPPPERLMLRAGSLGDMKSWWENALAKSITKRKTDAKTRMKSGHKAISLVGLLADSTRIDLFQVVDWTSEDEIDLPVTPLVEKYMFKPDKTYVLIGLTRDLGQSLCRLLIKHGARNIVLASRNPDLDLDWATELEQRAGANIIIKKVDVTELDQVTAFKQGLAEQCLLPPVGGLINGAMVLDDRIFAHMTTETWERVMRPKALGSRNLDAVFSNTDLEFFIMTSSFAAIGGHAGQSNYAAANMYMNGLAADRRRRGLAGSVLNIGVIYGLGFLHRERSELYAGLEREGYPPISERDVHHMVLEAIVAGRPHQPDGQPPPYDIIAGLSRFRLDKLDRLHWQQDPRFSHLAIIGSDDSHVDNDLPEPSVPFSDRIAAVTELREVQQLILEEFTQRLEVLLQTRPGLEICQDSRPSELGIDSLLAVDIRNWAAKKLGVDLAVMKILGPSSINKLCCEMARQVLDQRE
ncbi:hybrid polyketide synthase [Microdochium nivale]|nr:hybrid polyketide synthase [Microdochium nivale]